MGKLKVTPYNTQSPLIPIIVVPGFLTKDEQQWGEFIARKTFHPVYHINWESFSNSSFDTEKHFLDPIINFDIDALPVYYFTSNRPYKQQQESLRAIKKTSLAISLWNKACLEADFVTASMINFLNKNFNDKPFILLGHSLGGRIVSKISRGISTTNLLATIVIAGAIDDKEFNNITRSKDHIPSMGYINFHSKKDSILSMLYRAATFYRETPVGMVRSNGNRVINKQFALGHSEYPRDFWFSVELSNCIHAIQKIYDEELAPSRPLVVG